MRPHAILLSAFLASIGAMADSPGIFEVDLIFPQNKTYTMPNRTEFPKFPVVWAIRNAPQAKLLDARIEFAMDWGADLHPIQNGHPSIVNPNKTDYIQYATMLVLGVGLEGTYQLEWQVGGGQCVPNSGISSLTTPRSSIWFQIANIGGETPDLLAAAQDCAGRSGQAINIASVLNSPSGPTCAKLDEIDPFPEPDPCAVPINRVAISNITRDIEIDKTSNSGCTAPRQTGLLSCPAKSAAQFVPVGLLIWLPVAVAIFL